MPFVVTCECGKRMAVPQQRGRGKCVRCGCEVIVSEANTIPLECDRRRNIPMKRSPDCCVKTLVGHSDAVTSVAVSSDGQHLLSGSIDNTVRLWDVVAGTCPKVYEGQFAVRSVCFSPDGLNALVGIGDAMVLTEDDTWDTRGGRLDLWEVSSGNRLPLFQNDSGWAASVVFSPDGRLVLSADSLRNVLRLWSTSTGECIRTFHGHSGWVSSVAFSPDGRSILSGGNDKTVRLWDTHSGACLRVFEDDDPIQAVAFLPDGRHILTGDGFERRLEDELAEDGSFLTEDELVVERRGVARMRCLSSMECRTFQGHAARVASVAGSSDGLYLLSGSDDKTVKLWDISSGVCLCTFDGHEGAVTSVAFSPDCTYVVSASRDATVRVWTLDRKTFRKAKTRK